MSFSFLQLLAKVWDTCRAEDPAERSSTRDLFRETIGQERVPGGIVARGGCLDEEKAICSSGSVPTFSYTGIYHISGLKTSWPSINTGSWFVSGSALIQLSRGLAALHQLVVGAAHAQIWQVLGRFMVSTRWGMQKISKGLQPWKLTWIPKIAIFERRYILNTIILGIYVRFREVHSN